MAKRFFDSGLFEDEWFAELSIEAKLVWVYFLCTCDHAGVYKINRKLFKFQTGVDFDTVIQQLGNRLVTISKGLIFIPKFFKYQYPNFPAAKFKASESAFIRLLELNIDVKSYLTVSQDLINSYKTLNKELPNSYSNSISKGNSKGNSIGGSGGNFEPEKKYTPSPDQLEALKKHSEAVEQMELMEKLGNIKLDGSKKQ